MNFTVLQACEIGGVEVPRFCFHEHLSIAGNCRMCLVEVQKSLKPVASCAMPVMSNMVIFTNSSFVRRAREGVLEFLLVNHPLDCPICDQGGECDLQDQTVTFGTDRGRFYEYKRAVFDKELGPLIKTIMTRCIHCTRCVRFVREVSGVFDLGVVGRGLQMEIGTYINSLLRSELSGNIIDLCPVGALTAKPSAFRARSWELVSVEAVDIFDCFGSNIVLNIRGLEIIRVLPRVGRNFGWDWISDKVRFFYDGIYKQRLAAPFGRVKGRMCKFLWDDLLIRLWWFLKHTYNLHGVVGAQASFEMSVLFKEFLRVWEGINFISIESKQSGDIRDTFFFDFVFADIDRIDGVVCIQSNLKYELPLIHSRFRYNQALGFLRYSSLGGYYGRIGNTAGHCFEFFEGRLRGSIGLFGNKSSTKCFTGEVLPSLFDDLQSWQFNNFVLKYLKTKLNVLETEVGRLCLKELGVFSDFFKNKQRVSYEDCVDSLLYTIGGDCGVKNKVLKTNLLIYQGGFVDDFVMSQYSLLLPGVSFVERRGLYLNLFGFLQLSNFALEGPGKSKLDELILFSLLRSFVCISRDVIEDSSSKVFSGIAAFTRKFVYWFNLFFSITVMSKYLRNRIRVAAFRILGGVGLLELGRDKNLILALQGVHFRNVVLVKSFGVLSSVVNNYFQTSEVSRKSAICRSVVWVPSLFIKI